MIEVVQTKVNEGTSSTIRMKFVNSSPAKNSCSMTTTTDVNPTNNSKIPLAAPFEIPKESTTAKKNDSGNYVTSDAIPFVLLFTVWYAFNAGYNVFNAHSKIFPYPIAISTIQLVIGLVVYALPLWTLGIRQAPSLSLADIWRLLPIAALNALGHTTTVIAMFQKGGGSFAHVIKASEPVVSVLLGMAVSGNIPKPCTALSLLPISYGVAYASTLGKLDLTTMSTELTSMTAIMAMIGNIAFAFRSLARKNLSKEFKVRINSYYHFPVFTLTHLFIYVLNFLGPYALDSCQ